MRIINLTDEELPQLQGVEVMGSDLRDLFLEALNDGNPADVRAGEMRGIPFNYAADLTWVKRDENGPRLISAINSQEPWLLALPRQDAQGRSTEEVAETLCYLQIGPEPGTSIPLVVPVDVRNKQWYFAGTKSDLRLPIVFEVDQNGNVAGMTNFVHRTPPLYGAQIDPNDSEA